jgi:hypothetical protein
MSYYSYLKLFFRLQIPRPVPSAADAQEAPASVVDVPNDQTIRIGHVHDPLHHHHGSHSHSHGTIDESDNNNDNDMITISDITNMQLSTASVASVGLSPVVIRTKINREPLLTSDEALAANANHAIEMRPL